METLAQIVEALMDNNDPGSMLNNPMVQFGTANREYMGASILPTRIVDNNMYKETGIQYKTIVANDGTRYSPVQFKEGKRYGSFNVELAEQDVGSEFTSSDHDRLIRYLRSNQTMEAMTSALNWFNNTIILPLEEKIEVHRWEALTDAAILLRGDNDYSEDVLISNPAGHRVTVPSGTTAAPAGWYDDTRDPMPDIYAVVDRLTDKGYTVNRIITSRRIRNLLLRHPKMVQRKNTVVLVGGSVTTISGRLTVAELSAMFADDDLPAIEINDMVYTTSTGTKRFMRDTAFLMLATSGMTETIIDPESDDAPLTLENTLGYVGMGRPAGEGAPGRAWHMEMTQGKPRTIRAQAWQTTLPVITAPEAIACINIPYPT